MAADTHLQHDIGRSNRSCCCCCLKVTNQVEPLDPLDGSHQLVEIRPNRHICVHHYNARPRTKEFDEEMQAFMRQHLYGTKYRPSSIPAYKQKRGPRIKKQDISTPNVDNLEADPHRPQSPNDIISPSHLTTTLEAQSRESTHVLEQKTNSANNQVKSNKPVLFLIHGVGGCAEIWKAQIDFFTAQGYEVVVPELIGHGHSSGPRQASLYTFEEILIDMFLVFDIYCKQENIIIGHSYGACFAAVLARRREPLVQKLVMVSGGAPTPLAPQPGIFSLPICMLACCKPVLRRGFNKTAFYKHNIVPHKDKAFSVPTYVLKYVMNGQWWPEGDADYHCRINCPTLLIHGQDDWLISLEEEEEMNNTIYGSILHNFDHASHMVMMEQPKRVNNVLKAFITGVATEHSVAQSAVAMERATLSNGAAAHAQNGDVSHIAGNDAKKMADGQATPKNDDDISSIQSYDSAVLESYRIASPKKKTKETPKKVLSRESSSFQTDDATDKATDGRRTSMSRRSSAYVRQSRASLRSARSIPSHLVTANFK